ncbi:shikimate kinase [Blattabacterium sp. (Blaberus giganteus)]|uniref:shikimate kinase n=1 Tax=Blattabacterium sp. (Blaberus giganteus) TaxID=1186051 RepID=UPI00025F6ECF|nr:shikimate kinase [Blattabacterium sp. (Blaberus giganteus)]AFJ90656.1 shikimate kinase [Blattabacterium sp. (Blaberus giganteus)]
MKITLIGYMGSGKTTIGKMLSKKLNLDFYDLDALLVKKKNDSICNIFKKKGELFFRKTEHSMLKKILKKKNKYVLSVGGGTPCFYNNIYLLNKYSNTFYLKTDSYTLFKRLFLEKKTRPLISHLSKNELFRFVIKHLYKRIYFYEKSLERVNVYGKSKNDIVKEIIKSINYLKLS